MVEKAGSRLSVRRQCELLGLNRNRLDDTSRGGLGEGDLGLAQRIDEVHLRFPEFGARRMSQWLLREGREGANRRKVSQIMKAMGLQAIYRRPRTSQPAPGAQIYPYLLRDRVVTQADEVWCADVTYIPMARGFAYLVAIMDWKTRAVLSWKLSNTLDGTFCVEALREALEATGRAPGIFNTDQGCQFTSAEWADRLTRLGVRISMDGRGRWMDNVFIERLWRSVKYEEIYLKEHATIPDLRRGLQAWFERYNHWRPHAHLGNLTPAHVYQQTRSARLAA